ncbi:MAG: NTPase [Acidilobaceae archaeon]|nr:NTPase [Acidilobaceae archaeon]MCX8165978.1 NTPase [Acidilobaceae archaeon]MDW7974621.1 NTPase [Sulfolobales archaeon]
MRGLFITGTPGVGKSTLFFAIVEELRRRGCAVGGIYAPEVREGGRRVGFRIVDLLSGESAWLAKEGSGEPRVGRYVVMVEEAGKVGANAIYRAIRESCVIGIDEIGPMEMAIGRLSRAIEEALVSEKPVLAVIHRRLPETHPRIFEMARRRGQVIEVTLNNRSSLLSQSRRLSDELWPGGHEGREGPHLPP